MRADPPRLLHHLLRDDAAVRDRVALRLDDATLCHADLAAAARACATRLRAAGVRPGDRVVIHLNRGFAECWALFGVAAAGGVAVPANPALKGPQVAHIVADAGARVLVTEPALWSGTAGHVLGAAPGVTVLMPDGGPTATRLQAAPGGAPAPAEPARIDDPPRLAEDLAAILYTSGSTGRPKGVMLTHSNLLAGTRIVRTYLGLGPDDRLLSVLPLSFDYGLNQLLTAVEQGAELVLLGFRFAPDIVRAMARHRVTVLAGVPGVWGLIAQPSSGAARTPLPDLRILTNSGGHLDRATVDRLRGLWPHARLFLMYGLTEAFRSTYLPPEEIDRRPGSIGRAIPETEVWVMDADGRPAPPGTVGTLVHRGPTVSRGYWRRPEDTARVLRPDPRVPADEGGSTVCVSGDLVRQDDDGYLHFVGRADAMIKSSGFRISPCEVEEVLMATGAFAQVAVIGLPDPLLGDRVHAVGVPAAGAEAPVDGADLLRRCAPQLPNHALPRAVEWVEALPLGPTGKVDHAALRAARIQPPAGGDTRAA